MLEYLVIGLLVVTLLNMVFLYKISLNLKALIKVNRKLGQPSQADKDLSLGKHDAVIERCLNDIAKNPKHAKAHWYLGKAYFEKEMWDEAKSELELVGKLQPDWREESVAPYLEEIERQLGAVANPEG